MDFLSRLEEWFAIYVVDSIEAVIFFDVAFWNPDVTLPLVVLWLIFGATFFTLRFQFMNFRAFRHAIDCTRGRYTNPEASGEIFNRIPGYRTLPKTQLELPIPTRELPLCGSQEA